MRTIDKIITKTNSKFGAQMGRTNVQPTKTEIVNGQEMVYVGKTFDCKVPISSDGYDKGGAYWGIGKELRVQYNKDLSFVRFYRKN